MFATVLIQGIAGQGPYGHISRGSTRFGWQVICLEDILFVG